MSEPKVIHIDEIEGAHGGVFKPVGRTLGVTAFGVNVEQYPQGHDAVPRPRPRQGRPGRGLLRDLGPGHADDRRR